MYLVSYDIEDNKIRNKIAKQLENYGYRVQYSVFECRITQKRFHELYEKLATLMEEEIGGNIRFYHICENCSKKIVTMGIATQRDDDSDVIII